MSLNATSLSGYIVFNFRISRRSKKNRNYLVVETVGRNFFRRWWQNARHVGFSYTPVEIWKWRLAKLSVLFFEDVCSYCGQLFLTSRALLRGAGCLGAFRLFSEVSISRP